MAVNKFELFFAFMGSCSDGFGVRIPQWTSLTQSRTRTLACLIVTLVPVLEVSHFELGI
jgi:hypothetical protein